MKSKLAIPAILLLVLVAGSCKRSSESRPFNSYWDLLPDRTWIGPEFWANRLQDWRLRNGKVECVNEILPKRTLHLLDRYISGRPGSLHLKVESGLVRNPGPDAGPAWSGFLIGSGGATMDYRRRALIHGAYGKAGGMIAAVDPAGRIMIIENEDGEKRYISEMAELPVARTAASHMLTLDLVPKGEFYNMVLAAVDSETGEEVSRLDTLIRREGNFSGNIALICNGGRYWFNNLVAEGSKIRIAEDHRLGPVIGTQYTLSDGELRLTAQMAPLSESDVQEVELQVMDARTGKWNRLGKTMIRVPSYLAMFRIGEWNDEIRHDYRIVYRLTDEKGLLRPVYYYGVIVQDPVEKEELVLAAFTGNNNSHGSIRGEKFDFAERLWFPHEDLVSHVAKHNPDLLFYSGDNVYEGSPTPPDFSSVVNTRLDYLYKWYLFLWAHGELTRNIPSITIPDDHDVYHGNIWGESGARIPDKPENGIYPERYHGAEKVWRTDQGGYLLPPRLVNMIQQTQVSHLPEPFDPEPVKQGIEVYFCNVNYGRISWAVLEDRKFKSAPSRIHPDLKIINGFSQLGSLDPGRLNSPDASLLGERQLSFLREWSADWKGIDLKVALSQSVFANLSTYPDSFRTDAGTPRLPALPRGVIPAGYRKARDMDSNGWPRSGRNKALEELRKGFATMIGGDQHLGSVLHHGIDDWEDAGYSFCVPSIANLFPRRWFPEEPGENHIETMPRYTGRYYDGFGNRITVHAASNPFISGKEPARLHDRAPGYGIVRFNKKSQEISFECWPRYSDPDAFNTEQYDGWPIVFRMQENYSRKAYGWLPPVNVRGLERYPVVQVLNEITGEIIYTLRISSDRYQPAVFEEGTYSIHIGEPGTGNMKSFSGLTPSRQPGQESIMISFE